MLPEAAPAAAFVPRALALKAQEVLRTKLSPSLRALRMQHKAALLASRGRWAMGSAGAAAQGEQQQEQEAEAEEQAPEAAVQTTAARLQRRLRSQIGAASGRMRATLFPRRRVDLEAPCAPADEADCNVEAAEEEEQEWAENRESVRQLPAASQRRPPPRPRRLRLTHSLLRPSLRSATHSLLRSALRSATHSLLRSALRSALPCSRTKALAGPALACSRLSAPRRAP